MIHVYFRDKGTRGVAALDVNKGFWRSILAIMGKCRLTCSRLEHAKGSISV